MPSFLMILKPFGKRTTHVQNPPHRPFKKFGPIFAIFGKHAHDEKHATLFGSIDLVTDVGSML